MVHIKQDTFIGVIVYVKIGEEKHEVILKDMKVSTKPTKEDLSRLTVIPIFECKGNIHSRAKLSVKLESSSNPSEAKEFDAGELVVLRESEIQYPIDIPEPLPKGTEWKLTVKADFEDEDSPVLVGTKKYKIPRN